MTDTVDKTLIKIEATGGDPDDIKKALNKLTQDKKPLDFCNRDIKITLRDFVAILMIALSVAWTVGFFLGSKWYFSAQVREFKIEINNLINQKFLELAK